MHGLSPFKIRLARITESSFDQLSKTGSEKEASAKYLITFELTYRYQGNRTSRILRRALVSRQNDAFGSPSGSSSERLRVLKRGVS